MFRIPQRVVFLTAPVFISVALTLVVINVPVAAVPAVPTYAASQLQFTYTQQGRISESEVADFNCDNRPDVILSNGVFQSGQAWPVTIALSDGNGGYTNGTSQIFVGAVGSSEHLGKMLIEDYNNDGRPDVFVADSGIDGFPFTGRQNHLYLSTADCRLIDASTTHLPQQSDFTHSATVADIDSDGDVDIYVGNIWGANLIPPQIWLNDGTAHFVVANGLLPAAQTDLDQARYTSSLFVDVNNDGHQDLVLADDQNHNQSVVLINDGTGHFTNVPGAITTRPFGTNGVPLDVKSTDFNHDGYADLAIEFSKFNPYYQGRWIQLLKNNGNSTFTDETATRLFPTQVDNFLTWLLFVHFVDVDGDGNNDLIGQMVGTNNDSHRFYLANGSGVFTETPLLNGQLGDVFALVDARGDGHRDVIDTRNIGNDQHTVRLLSNTSAIVAPGAPQRVRPTRNLTGHIRLFWQYDWGATSYEVWRSAVPGSHGQLVGTTSTTSFDDTGISGTFYYEVRAVNSGGTSDYTAQVRGSALPNLAQNGNFTFGTNGWTVYGFPTSGDIQASIVSGVMQFTRGLTANNQAAVFQDTGMAVPANTGLNVQFEVGNSSNVRKRISVLLIEKDFSDITVCTFWLPPHSPLRQYGMRTHSTKAWNLGAALYFYAATQGTDGGAYLLDNVYLHTETSLGGTRCIDPTAPGATGASEGPELLLNGDFGQNTLDHWSVFGQLTPLMSGSFYFFRPPPGIPAGGILQYSGVPVPAGSIVSARFKLGNLSPVRKRVTVLLQDADYSDLAACTFWIPPGQVITPAVEYTMRTFTTKAWINATLNVFAATVDNEAWTGVDDFTMKVTPGTATSGTDCGEPGGESAAPAASVQSPILKSQPIIARRRN